VCPCICHIPENHVNLVPKEGSTHLFLFINLLLDGFQRPTIVGASLKLGPRPPQLLLQA